MVRGELHLAPVWTIFLDCIACDILATSHGIQTSKGNLT